MSADGPERNGPPARKRAPGRRRRAPRPLLERSRTDLLRLFHEIAELSNGAESLDAAFESALRRIGERVGCAVGHVYVPGDGAESRWVDAGVLWLADPTRQRGAADRCAKASFRSGEGAPGRAASRGEVSCGEPGPALWAGGDPPLRWSWAVPVRTRERVAAVLELLSDSPAEPDPELRAALKAAGILLGRVVERERSLARYRAVVEDQTECICRFTPDGRMTFLNGACCRLFEGELGELLGGSFFSFVRQEALPALREMLDRLSAEEAVISRELELERADGSRAWIQWTFRALFDGRGRLAELQAVGRDVTPRRQAERAAEASRHFAEKIADAVPLLLFVWDLPSRRLVYLNSRAAMLGYPVRESRISDFLLDRSVLHPEERGDLERQLARALQAADGEVVETELRLRRADGEWRRFRVDSVVFTRDRRGRAIQLLGAAQDITPQRDAERQLEASREKLHRLTAQLMKVEDEERRRISRELHDELNQRLALLCVDADTLQRSLAPDAGELRERIRRLRETAGQLSDHVHRIAYQLHPVILDDLGLPAALRAYAENLSRLHGFAVSVHARGVPPVLPRPVASCLYRIGQEALSNAARHSGSARATVFLAGLRDRIVLSVRDAGRGFDRAAVTRNERSGLGLIGMEERVRALGGSIAIEAAPGRGVRLRAWVPLHGDTGSAS